MAFATYSKKQSSELSERHGKGELDGISRVAVKAFGSTNLSGGPSTRMIESMKRLGQKGQDRFSIKRVLELRQKG